MNVPKGQTKVWIGNGLLRRPPPKPDGRFSRIRLSSLWRIAMNWLRHSTQGFRRSRTSRVGLRPAHLDSRRSIVGSASVARLGLPSRPCAQPRGTTRTLAGWLTDAAQHHIPALLGSTIVTRFFATTRAPTPTGPFATSRGSLIHVTRTSKHSVSNHLRTSASRDPLPLRWQHDFVLGFATAMQARQFRRPKRVHFVPCMGNRRYGLLVHFQLLSTRGCGPSAVTFNFWPFSVGQVRDLHPAVQVRFQAHIAQRFNGGFPGGRGTSPVRDDRKPCDIPDDRILRNHEIKSVAFFRPSGALGLSEHCYPPLKRWGYFRSSLRD